MIVIAGRSLAQARVGRTPGLCHALAVELLLGLFGFAIGGIESFGPGEHSKCEIRRACKHGAGLGKTSTREVGFSLAHSTVKCNRRVKRQSGRPRAGFGSRVSFGGGS